MTGEELEGLCDEHWIYIEQVIRNEYDSEPARLNGEMFALDAYCRKIGLHYRLAMAHGFKHGVASKSGGKL